MPSEKDWALRGAAATAKNGAWAKCLDHLLEAWDELPHPDIAAVIEHVGPRTKVTKKVGAHIKRVLREPIPAKVKKLPPLDRKILAIIIMAFEASE